MAEPQDTETKTYKSSTIMSSVYNFKEKRLTIRFQNNNVYRFENVDLNDYKRFSTDTISPGKAFYREINSKYKGTKL
jgi:hypothetical protein